MQDEKGSSGAKDVRPYEFVLRDAVAEVKLRPVSLAHMRVLKRVLGFLRDVLKTKDIDELIVNCGAIDSLSFSLFCKFVLFNISRQADERAVKLRVEGLDAEALATLKSMGLGSLAGT
jgi:hypothetical protein